MNGFERKPNSLAERGGDGSPGESAIRSSGKAREIRLLRSLQAWSAVFCEVQTGDYGLTRTGWPAVMSPAVRTNPLLVLVSVLVAGAIGNWPGGTFGVVAALLAILTAASPQIAVLEIWRAESTAQTLPAGSSRRRFARFALTREHAGPGG